MAKIQEARVEQDADGRVIIERPKRGGLGFGFGVLVGIVLIVGAMLAFVYSQGSFQQAAIEADRMFTSVERQADATIDGAQQAANESSGTLTN